LEPGRLEAPLDRVQREAGVVLAARQPFFLDRAHRDAVDDECGGGIVVMGGDAEDLHVSTGCSPTRCGARMRWGRSRPVRAVRCAWPATLTAAARRNTGSSGTRSP